MDIIFKVKVIFFLKCDFTQPIQQDTYDDFHDFAHDRDYAPNQSELNDQGEDFCSRMIC